MKIPDKLNAKTNNALTNLKDKTMDGLDNFLGVISRNKKTSLVLGIFVAVIIFNACKKEIKPINKEEDQHEYNGGYNQNGQSGGQKSNDTNEIKKQIIQLETDSANKVKYIADLKKDSADKVDEIAKLEVKINSMETQISQAEAKINAMESDTIPTAAQAVRNAVLPATTTPDDVSWLFWANFGNFGQMSFTDTVKRYMFVIDDFRRDYGDPLPSNDVTLSQLYDLCKAYLALEQKLSDMKKDLCDLKKNLKNLNKNLTDLNNDLATLGAHIATESARIAKEIEEIEKQLKELREELEKLRKEANNVGIKEPKMK